MYDLATRNTAIAWFNTTPKMREPRSKSKLAFKLGISTATLNNWENQWRNNGRKPLREHPVGILSRSEMDALIDKLAGMDETQREAFKLRVFQRALEPNASAAHMELYAKLGDDGKLVDKSEVKVKVGFDADEYARIRIQAKRELEEFSSQGNREVRSEPPILSGDLRLSTGQGTESDNQVPVLGTSTSTPG
jgi:hypothetical protein